jgi:hypothetical protein
MNPEQRRKRAAELADEINSNHLLQDDLRFLLTDLTMARMSTADNERERTMRRSHDINPTTPRPQFSY